MTLPNDEDSISLRDMRHKVQPWLKGLEVEGLLYVFSFLISPTWIQLPLGRISAGGNSQASEH